MTIETFIVAILPSLCVSVIMALFNKKQDKRDARMREREARHKDSEKVQVSLLVATAKLSYATAMAWKRGHANGEVEEGVEQYREAMKAFKDFERSLVAESSAE